MFAEPNYPDKSLIEKFPACYNILFNGDDDVDVQQKTLIWGLYSFE